MQSVTFKTPLIQFSHYTKQLNDAHKYNQFRVNWTTNNIIYELLVLNVKRCLLQRRRERLRILMIWD